MGVIMEGLAEVAVVIRNPGAAIAQDVRDEHSDLLGMAVVAAFADVEIAAG
jgi:hypothetical protein